MFKQRRGRKTKRTKRRGMKASEPLEVLNAPHSIVVYRGQVGKHIRTLMQDFRKVMQPYTASSLQVKKYNVLKDYVAIAGIFHVTHLCAFTHTEMAPYLKIGRISQGPTLTFQILKYSLSHHVLSSLKRQVNHDRLFNTHPLLVLNNFSGEGMEMQLMASMLQSLFPSINVAKVKLNFIRRCVMLNYNSADKTVDFRHYSIRVVPQGVSRSVKKLTQNRLPNLSQYNDISEFIMKSGNISDSEAEDDPASHVTVPQNLSSRENSAFKKLSVRLVELGPRITLQLIKIESGLFQGEVLFHEHIHKSMKEKMEIKERLIQKRKLKQQRKQEQEKNVQRKKAEKELHKQKSLEGMMKLEEKQAKEKASVEDDDAEWYRQEVGEEPEKGMFTSHKRQKRSNKGDGEPEKKKMKTGGPQQIEMKEVRIVGKKMKKVPVENKKAEVKILGKKIKKGGLMENKTTEVRVMGKKIRKSGELKKIVKKGGQLINKTTEVRVKGKKMKNQAGRRNSFHPVKKNRR